MLQPETLSCKKKKMLSLLASFLGSLGELIKKDMLMQTNNSTKRKSKLCSQIP